MPQNPLGDLIGRLLREPLVLILLLSWILGGIGKLAQARKKAAQRAQPNGGLSDVAESMQRPVSQRRSPEEVAAEMRRLLGMDRSPAAQPAPVPRPVVAPALKKPARREAKEGDREPEPLRASSMSKFGTHVDPHVGESMQRRSSVMSGGVASHELGTLGGRRGAAAAHASQRARGLVDLSDLSRAFVLREILDQPRALRGFDY
jgi:hypothetical protein